MLESGNVLAEKFSGELAQEETKTILKDLKHIPLQRHPDMRLFRPAYALALDTLRSLYDCLYLALAVVDGKMVMADRKFYDSLPKGPTRIAFSGWQNFLSNDEANLSIEDWTSFLHLSRIKCSNYTTSTNRLLKLPPGETSPVARFGRIFPCRASLNPTCCSEDSPVGKSIRRHLEV
jgi:hypothetical protein